MSGTGAHHDESYTTSGLAAASGYSVQQVRDLERLRVIPPAERRSNGYRRFGRVHESALRAYRLLALAVGPVVARETMRDIRLLPIDEAVARIVALHVGLAHSRDDTVAALRALDSIVDESAHEVPAAPGDVLTVTELSAALGVRSSTLRFWELEGLIAPERAGPRSPRRYDPDAVNTARIVAALRAGGYGVPAVRAVMTSLREIGDPRDARGHLQDRLQRIAARSEALLRAGTDLADLLRAADIADGSGAAPAETAPRA